MTRPFTEKDIWKPKNLTRKILNEISHLAKANENYNEIMYTLNSNNFLKTAKVPARMWNTWDSCTLLVGG